MSGKAAPNRLSSEPTRFRPVRPPHDGRVAALRGGPPGDGLKGKTKRLTAGQQEGQYTMAVFTIKKGYSVPIAGEAERAIEDVDPPTIAGVSPTDLVGLKLRLLVAEKDRVKRGTPLVQDKHRPEIVLCAPVAGVVETIRYGPRRSLAAIYIAVEGDDAVQHPSFRPADVRGIGRPALVQQLLAGGLWPFLRRRPFDTIPDPTEKPDAVFVNCMNTAPLANDPEFSLRGKQAEFRAGVEALTVLADGSPVHMVLNGAVKESVFPEVDGVARHSFRGRHPAGLVSTHISRLSPLHGRRCVWYMNARDVVLLGAFLLVGQYSTERIISVVGPSARKRRYFRAHLGAWLLDLVGEEIESKDSLPRFISGDVLTGRTVDRFGFLGLYDDMITIVPETQERQFLGWMTPGKDRWSFSRSYLSGFLKGPWAMNTNLNGEERALVKTGDYDRVVALDVLPDFLVKAILAGDIDQMEQLGILECAPEDFALCSYICPSKVDFTEVLRSGLEMMRKEMV